MKVLEFPLDRARKSPRKAWEKMFENNKNPILIEYWARLLCQQFPGLKRKETGMGAIAERVFNENRWK